ncbi:hypothetical protein [Arthrobacter sp. HY1533]|uniref:hypothetical protein n=1 Tax=Arthrobacter sp. HY1533 TaxID=2970919 RepID=UPI0022B9F599|nr:hypothetical protein [Arthrobacter sp. HY1533]
MDGLTTTIIEVDPGVWASLIHGPQQRCEHSRHNDPGWQHTHGGPATHYIKAVHRCTGTDPIVYPACNPFAQYVLSHMGMDWMCPACKHIDKTQHMVQVVAIIDH